MIENHNLPNSVKRSEKSQEIIDDFKYEFQRAQTSEGEPYSIGNFADSPNPQDFLTMIQELLNLSDIAPANLADAIMPESLLQKRLQMIETDSTLKADFEAGYRIQPALIPFSYYGKSLSEDEIVDGAHLGQLTREDNERGRTVGGYSSFPSYIHKLFPQELQDIYFVVPKYDSDDDHEVTDGDRERLKKAYTEAFYRLKDKIKEIAARTYH